MTGPGPDDPDIFEGLSFAEDYAAQAVNRPRLTDRQSPDPDRDGQKWRSADPRLPEDVSRRLHRHLAAGRARRRVAIRHSDAAGQADARRRIELANDGLGIAGGSWWNSTVAEAVSRAVTSLDVLDLTWGER